MTIAKPRIGELAAGEPALVREAKLRNLELTGLDWSDQEVVLVKIDEVVATSMIMMGIKLVKLEVGDTRFKGCELTGTKLLDSAWLRAEFIASRCSGVDFSGAHLSDVLFKDCKLDLANFRWTSLKRVIFQDCELREADFGSAKLYDVTFENCNIEQVDLSQAQMANVDLRSSSLIDLKGVMALKGATVSRDQLIQISGALAAESGIKIAE